MTDCRSLQAHNSQEKFRNYEEKKILLENTNSKKADAGSSMLRCDGCEAYKNQLLTKVVDRECFCCECTSRLVLYTTFEL